MPFYEYECPHCRYYVEVMQKISDTPLRKCPSCGKAGFKRLVSAPAFRLKGSGWYETDFKSDKEGRRNLVGEEREPAKAAVDSTDKGGKAAVTGDGDKSAASGDAKPAKAAPATAGSVKSRRRPASRPRPAVVRKSVARSRHK
jgi:putative FmdB family regulatory protein